MPNVPGLRSPYARVGRLVYFGRMLDKIRLHSAGALPDEYRANLGENRSFLFDARCCRFLGIPYEALRERVQAGGSDQEILEWAEAQGIRHTGEECDIWNRFMIKIGWRDDRSEALAQRIAQFGLEGKGIETSFDLLEVDEGRDPKSSRPWELRPARVIVIMGVAGSGKTTIGVRLAGALGWKFNDADEFHPSENVSKMSAGTPLTDEDRAPWLKAIRAHIDRCLARDESAVVTCSALKHRYRDALDTSRSQVTLVYLKGSRELLWARISQRENHFMKREMLNSQLEALEEPTDAIVVDVSGTPDQIVSQIRSKLGV